MCAVGVEWGGANLQDLRTPQTQFVLVRDCRGVLCVSALCCAGLC